MELFIKGIVLGFSIAAPVGPIGVLCIRRTLAHGRLVGFVSGLGAASADMLYGAVAAFGLAAVSAWLIEFQHLLSFAGGSYLFVLGVRTFFSPPAEKAAEAGLRSNGLLGAYVSTLLLTLTNPVTILSFGAVFIGMGLVESNLGSYAGAGLLVCGVFFGSAVWWMLLSGGVGLFRERISERWMVWVNRAAGLLLVIFAVAILTSGLLR